METVELYQEARREGIPVLWAKLPENGSMCVQTAQGCYIGLDEGALGDEASTRVHLGHELGHCVTGSFYNIWAARDVRQKHENRADKWAIERLVPREELAAQVAAGHTEVWELAEHFGVTEEFMRKAVCWHERGNLDVANY